MTSLVLQNPNEFTHILRFQNTNVNGKQKAPFGIRQIRGVGRRFAILALKIAQIDLNKRSGELTEKDMTTLNDILARPTEYNIPKWFLNRQKDPRDGTWSQLISNNLDTRFREDLERMRKAKNHRGLRHYWGQRVRGQRTKSTGRCGKTLGVIRKK
uniref:40S ribosomal protein S18 n=1 Tax=Strombidium rassoulzadegani TaxID=1082188 RepID=A0A7S3CTA3_9SPIT|mmetsp:Transcript_7896/g.13246  ORF Transcript_7896/g.13246 Transcript_7896/m.13246 type:complete len:156 (+) Transcript_7896:55-522(+)